MKKESKLTWEERFDEKFPYKIYHWLDVGDKEEPLTEMRINKEMKSFIYSELSLQRKELIKEVMGIVSEGMYVFERPKEDYLPEVYKHLKSKNEAHSDILEALKELSNK